MQIIWIVFSMASILFIIKNGYLNYETNDDFFLSAITGGMMGEYYPFAVHHNIVMGAIIAFLSRMLAFIPLNIAMVSYLVGIALAYVVLGCRLTRDKGLTGLLLSVLILMITEPSLLNSFNYSKTGAFLIMAGSVVLCSSLKSTIGYVESERCDRSVSPHNTQDTAGSIKYLKIICSTDSKKWFVLSALLIIMGSLYRYKTLFAVIPFMAICFVYGLFGILSHSRKSEKLHTYLKAWLIVVVTIAALWIADYAYYHGNAEWRYYKEFNDLREQIIDYEIPSYEGHEEDYRAIGWSENDLELFRQWTFADSDTYNVAAFRGIKAMQPGAVDRLFSGELLTSLKEMINFVIYSRYFRTIAVLWLMVFLSKLAYVSDFNKPVKQRGDLSLVLNNSETHNSEIHNNEDKISNNKTSTNKDINRLYKILIYIITPLITVMLVIAELWLLYFLGRAPERALFIPLTAGLLVLCLLLEQKNSVVYVALENPIESAKPDISHIDNKTKNITDKDNTYESDHYKSLNSTGHISIISIIIILACIYNAMAWVNLSPFNATAECEKTLSLLSDISQKDDSLYVWDTLNGADTLHRLYYPLEKQDFGILKNSVMTGGWLYPTPMYHRICEPFGDGRNILGLLSRGGNVYFISSREPSTELLAYMKEHYLDDKSSAEPAINYEVIKEYGELSVFRIS